MVQSPWCPERETEAQKKRPLIVLCCKVCGHLLHGHRKPIFTYYTRRGCSVLTCSPQKQAPPKAPRNEENFKGRE